MIALYSCAIITASSWNIIHKTVNIVVIIINNQTPKRDSSKHIHSRCRVLSIISAASTSSSYAKDGKISTSIPPLLPISYKAPSINKSKDFTPSEREREMAINANSNGRSIGGASIICYYHFHVKSSRIIYG